MIISILYTKLKSLFLFVAYLFRRAMCCIKRRRRISENDEPLSLIVVNENAGKEDLEQWNDWEFKNRKPANVQEHIEYYRQQKAKLLKQPSAEETIDENVDLFENMTPQIVKQQKIYVPSQNEGNNKLNLNVQNEDLNFMSKDLENWDENTGWDNDASQWGDTQELLREKRRQEREKRLWEQQQKRIEKSSKPNVLGAKISS